MPRGRPKKNPFEGLPESWREEIDALGNNESALRDRIAKVALDNAALKGAEKEDQDLNAKKEEVKTARSMYTEGYKAHKLMIDYLRAQLRANGKPCGESGVVEDKEE
jgi:hypothetical protein